ncbi:YjcZ family sporulation protein [Neobacillus kokaensis]
MKGSSILCQRIIVLFILLIIVETAWYQRIQYG